MPEITFTDKDRQLIEDLLEKWEPSTHPIMEGVSDRMPAGEWEELLTYMRSHIKSSTVWALLAPSVVETANQMGMEFEGGARGRSPAFEMYVNADQVPVGGTCCSDMRYYQITKHLEPDDSLDSAPWVLLEEARKEIELRIFPQDARFHG